MHIQDRKFFKLHQRLNSGPNKTLQRERHHPTQGRLSHVATLNPWNVDGRLFLDFVGQNTALNIYRVAYRYGSFIVYKDLPNP
jgi:hypothetical protein